MTKQAMKYPRLDRGPVRVLEREAEVDYSTGRPQSTVIATRVYTGPRKALRS